MEGDERLLHMERAVLKSDNLSAELRPTAAPPKPRGERLLAANPPPSGELPPPNPSLDGAHMTTSAQHVLSTAPPKPRGEQNMRLLADSPPAPPLGAAALDDDQPLAELFDAAYAADPFPSEVLQMLAVGFGIAARFPLASAPVMASA